MYMLLIEGRIKQGRKDDFLKTWNSHILPLLQRQDGFVDEILLFEQGEKHGGAGLCFWETQAQAEHYRGEVFPQAASFVEHLLEGTPTLRGFEVKAAEIFQIAADKAA
jgi:hypothetical protein